jgi:hypothetical protein
VNRVRVDVRPPAVEIDVGRRQDLTVLEQIERRARLVEQGRPADEEEESCRGGEHPRPAEVPRNEDRQNEEEKQGRR